jgi:hypothetical protein
MVLSIRRLSVLTCRKLHAPVKMPRSNQEHYNKPRQVGVGMEVIVHNCISSKAAQLLLKLKALGKTGSSLKRGSNILALFVLAIEKTNNSYICGLNRKKRSKR